LPEIELKIAEVTFICRAFREVGTVAGRDVPPDFEGRCPCFLESV
jgi:hypothetical protein